MILTRAIRIIVVYWPSQNLCLISKYTIIMNSDMTYVSSDYIFVKRRERVILLKSLVSLVRKTPTAVDIVQHSRLFLATVRTRFENTDRRSMGIPCT